MGKFRQRGLPNKYIGLSCDPRIFKKKQHTPLKKKKSTNHSKKVVALKRKKATVVARLLSGKITNH